MPEGAFRFPRWLPTRAEALEVRRSAVRNRSPSSCPSSRKTEALPSLQQAPVAEAPGSAWQAMDRNPGSCRFAAPAPEGPVLPDLSEAEAPSSPVAAREPKSRFPPGWSWTRRSGVRPGARFLPSPKALPVPDGRFRNLPLSHPLKGKPAASAWRRLRQPPCLRVVASSSGGTRRPGSLGLVAGRLSSVAGRSSRPRMKAVTKTDSHKADFGRFRLWITRITGITETPLKYSPRSDCRARIGAVAANRRRTARLAARARPA